MTDERKLYVLTDFDGTIFNTLTKRPGFVNVDEACLRAVDQTFGTKGLIAYEHIGFLNNREPGELVFVLTETARKLGLDLKQYPSEGIATEVFVDNKLSHTLPQISTKWPLPYPGVIEFFRDVQEGKLPISVGIISSGHEAFIRKTFEVNDLTLPEIMATSDEIRHLKQPKRPKYKPYTYQLAAIHKRLLEHNPIDDQFREQQENKFIGRDTIKPNLVYIGDDPVKDMGVAERARILGIFVPFVHPDYHPDHNKGRVRLEDFQEIRAKIVENTLSIRNGATWSEILLGMKDEQLFPPVTQNQRPYSRWLIDPTNPAISALFP